VSCTTCEDVLALLDRQVRAAAARLDTRKSISMSVPCPHCRALWTLALPGAAPLQMPEPVTWKLHEP
jgi:hypothetical protein